MERYTIYIRGTEVVIATEPPASHYALIEADTSLHISRAKLIKKVETDKFIAIVTPSPSETFALLCGEFRLVRAAGGVVVNERGEVLMIELRGRWDLPKGHIDEGEESRAAALREVLEETGIVAEAVGDTPLMTTYHAYDTYGAWELKPTDWWQMRYTSGEPAPQHEEGITAAAWCGGVVLKERLKTSYATINAVVGALEV